MQADHEVARRGHDLRTGAGTDPGQVLGEGHVADPVQGVLDLPVLADPRSELIGPGLVRVEVGDRVDGLGAPAPLAPSPGRGGADAAGELDGLSGVRKLDPGGDDHDREGADLPAPVRGLGPAVTRLDVAPGQRGELAA